MQKNVSKEGKGISYFDDGSKFEGEWKNGKKEGEGSFYYDDKLDALRVTVKPVPLDKSVEWLKYEFVEHGEKHCVVAMQWEKVSVPFKISTSCCRRLFKK